VRYVTDYLAPQEAHSFRCTAEDWAELQSLADHLTRQARAKMGPSCTWRYTRSDALRMLIEEARAGRVTLGDGAP
jgi:hypothetical protein